MASSCQEYHLRHGEISRFPRYNPQTRKSKLGGPIPPAPALATEFEMQVRQLRLTEEMYVFSAELHGWCGRTESGPHPRMAT